MLGELRGLMIIIEIFKIPNGFSKSYEKVCILADGLISQKETCNTGCFLKGQNRKTSSKLINCKKFQHFSPLKPKSHINRPLRITTFLLPVQATSKSASKSHNDKTNKLAQIFCYSFIESCNLFYMNIPYRLLSANF